MAGTKLIFKAPPRAGSPVKLVFGADDGGPVLPPTVSIEGGGRITGLRGHLRLRLGVRAMVSGQISRLRGHMEVHWNSNVSRATRVELGAAWQEAAPVAGAALQTAWQEATPQRLAVSSHWQQARPQPGVLRAEWQEAERLRDVVLSGWQQGEGLHAGITAHWQAALRLRSAIRTGWQQAEGRRAGSITAWRDALYLRAALAGQWQEAAPLRASVRSRHGDGQRLHITLRSLWQEAMRPRPGVSAVVPPVVRPPCYVPSSPVRLVFSETARNGSPNLVFICKGLDGNPPGTVIVVPARRSYIVINSIEVRRADALAGDPLPSESFQMSLNRQSWTWTFSASFHASARDALAPGPGGQPVELEVRVNGQPFRMQGERIGRTRRFPEHLVTLSGRGKAAVLDAPYSAVQTFSPTLDRTAQALMTDVLTVNGVGFGWSVDFQLADWLIPAGAWMHQGTWVSALADIAGSVGGYLQPHDTDPVLRVLPLWPLPWWRWDTLTPEIDLPEGIAEVDETQVVDLPEFNRIFVSGESMGVQADLTRAGTAGDVLKQPMVVHPAITNIGAAKMRAIAELADSGRQLKHRMTLPVLPETGVIKPGRVLRYYDDTGVQRLGLVRGTSITQQFPVLTQSLEVDSHA